MKNRYIILILWVVLGPAAFSQQDPQYSQYMFNGLILNPAYAGSKEIGTLDMIYRKQWIGVDGAPTNQSISFHGPSANFKHGFGVGLTNDQIGPTRKTGGALTYAYRILLSPKSRLAFGLQGSLHQFRNDLGGLRFWNQNDPSLAQQNVNILLGNVGTGVYFNSQWAYLGASIPRLLNNSLAGTQDPSGKPEARESRQGLLTGGLVVPLGQNVKFRPSTLVKVDRGAPLSLDLNAAFLFSEKLWLGVSNRIKDSWCFTLEWWIVPALRIGYAFDLTSSQLGDYNSGSHEFMLGFNFDFLKKGMISPRYF